PRPRLQSAPAALPFPPRQPAAVELDALADPDQPVPAALSAAPAGAIVDDLEFELAASVAENDDGVAGVCVLEHVRQRLLDDPVGREVEAGRKRLRLTLHPQLRLDSGGTRLLKEPSEIGEPWLRRERGIAVALAQATEQPPHLDQRAPRSVLDRFHGSAGELRVDRERALGCVGLDRDHTDAVSDLHVELAGDPY